MAPGMRCQVGIVARQCWRMVPSPSDVAALFCLFGCVDNYNDTNTMRRSQPPLLRNEQIKLRANWLNTMATAVSRSPLS